MRKSYEGLKEALECAQNIIEANTGLAWLDLLFIFSNDPIIKPYYFDVTDALVAGRNSLRFEK